MTRLHEAKARAALTALKARGLKVALAESCTGGLVSAALTDIPGSSAVVERGFVTYSNEAKSDLLGVPPDLIARFGAVSEAVARAMAEGALAASRADVAVAVTGVAGPGGSDRKPEGLVHFACARRGADTVETRREFGALGRARVREASVGQALDMLSDAAEASGPETAPKPSKS
ncbi:MAG: CinA family protein [Rubrimonas sp.]|uniref:CinA family protein n=1 Tax=Rubrimonas sp. TaxID=2036015 RepID=UPI002FDD5245